MGSCKTNTGIHNGSGQRQHNNGKKDNKIARKILLTNAKWKTSRHDNEKMD